MTPPPREVVQIVADLVACRSALDTLLGTEPMDPATATRLHRMHYQIAALESEYRKAVGLGPDALIFV